MKKKVTCNIFTNIILQASLAISGLIIPRFILAQYGSEMNGLVNSINQFISYLMLVELGVGNAAVVALYAPLVNNTSSKINVILSNVRRKYCISGFIYLFFMILLAAIYPLILGGQVGYWFSFSMVIMISGSGLIDFFLIGKYKVLLIADQRYYILNIFRIIAVCITTLCSCYLLLNQYSLILIKFLAVVTHFGEVVGISIYVKHEYPFIDFTRRNSSLKINQQSNALIHQIANVIVYNTDLAILTICIPEGSLKEVSVYTTFSMVFSMVTNLMATLTTGINATFGNMIAKKEYHKLKIYFDRYEYFYLLILYPLYTSFICLILPFVRCYTKGISDVNYIRDWVGILFGINGILAQLKDTSVVLITAAGHYKQTQKYVIAESVVNLVVSLILVRRYGIEGVLIGTMLSHCIADIGMVCYASRYILKRSFIIPLKKNVLNMVGTVFLVLVEFQRLRDIDDWMRWFLTGIGVVIVNFIFFFFVNVCFDRKFKEILLVELKEIRHKS